MRRLGSSLTLKLGDRPATRGRSNAPKVRDGDIWRIRKS